MCSRPSPPLELLADFGVCVTDSALFASSQIPLAAGAVILLGDRDRLFVLDTFRGFSNGPGASYR